MSKELLLNAALDSPKAEGLLKRLFAKPVGDAPVELVSIPDPPLAERTFDLEVMLRDGSKAFVPIPPDRVKPQFVAGVQSDALIPARAYACEFLRQGGIVEGPAAHQFRCLKPEEILTVTVKER